MPKIIIKPARLPATFDPADLWLLIGIDYRFLDYDPLGFVKFEDREPGCVPAMFKAYRTMLGMTDIKLLDKKYSVSRVATEILKRTKTYHKLVSTSVVNLQRDCNSGEFRNGTNVGFGMILESRSDRMFPTASEAGVQAIQKRKFVRGPQKQPEIKLYYHIVIREDKSIRVQADLTKKNEIENTFNLLCERLIEDLRLTSDTDKRLQHVAAFIQDAMLLHPFGDANNRTFVCMLLNDFLYSVQESPALFVEANIFDGFDIPTLVKKLKEGQQLFKDTISGIRRPQQASLVTMLDHGIIKIAALAGELELLKKLLHIMPLTAKYSTSAISKLADKITLIAKELENLNYDSLKNFRSLIIDLSCQQYEALLKVLHNFSRKYFYSHIYWGIASQHVNGYNEGLTRSILHMAMFRAINNENYNVFYSQFEKYSTNIGFIYILLELWGVFNNDISREFLARAIVQKKEEFTLHGTLMKALNNVPKDLLDILLDNNRLIITDLNIYTICDHVYNMNNDQKLNFITRFGKMIIKEIVNSNDLYIQKLSKLFNAQNDKLFEILIKDPNYIPTICKSVYDISSLTSYFPSKTQQLYTLLTRDFLDGLCKDSDNVRAMSKIFPEMATTKKPRLRYG